MNNLEQYIQSYFGIIHSADIQVVSSLFKLASFEKGDLTLRQGTRCTQMYFIQSGMLRLFSETEDKEVTQWISTPGYFVTDLTSFLFNQPARWSIQALTDVAVYAIDQSDYLRLGSLVRGWQDFERLFMAKCFVMMEERIFQFLSLSAEERYILLFESNTGLFNQVPLQYIASMLGMTPETLSRIRKKRLKTL